MLQALLESAGLTPDDLTIIEYPDFGQGAAVMQDAVDAATGFANNEPIQLELTGEKASVLRVDDITPLPGPGSSAARPPSSAKHDAIAAFMAATLRAMQEITDDPKVGLDAAIDRGPRARVGARYAGGDPRRHDRLLGGPDAGRPWAWCPRCLRVGRRRSTT